MMWLLHIFAPTIEIACIAVMVYYLFSFFWNTRAMYLLYGTLGFLGCFGVARWLHLPVLEKLMSSVIYLVLNVAFLGLLILFQPELRLALSKLSIKNKKYRETTEFDQFLETLSQSIYRLSERRIGALIVLENQDSLEDLAQKSVLVQARFSQELLESLFVTTTPLHDGAVLIRGTMILSAATILPLADDSTHLSKSMGTRHRAALGISQITDCVAIVVSEETGKVSLAREGIMTRGVKSDRFKGVLHSVFYPAFSKSQYRFSWKEGLKLWNS